MVINVADTIAGVSYLFWATCLSVFMFNCGIILVRSDEIFLLGKTNFKERLKI